MSNNGWIEWKGGEIPVERGTLVDLKFRGYGTWISLCCIAGNYFWHHDDDGSDIIAYRLHQEEKPELEQPVPTLDSLMHAWQKAKANADTSRNILKLAEQDEADARKALDDALRDSGYDKVGGDIPKLNPLSITDWRYLEPGDIVWWSGDSRHNAGEYQVHSLDSDDHVSTAFSVKTQTYSGHAWVNLFLEKWHFIRRPA